MRGCLNIKFSTLVAVGIIFYLLSGKSDSSKNASDAQKNNVVADKNDDFDYDEYKKSDDFKKYTQLMGILKSGRNSPEDMLKRKEAREKYLSEIPYDPKYPKSKAILQKTFLDLEVQIIIQNIFNSRDDSVFGIVDDPLTLGDVDSFNFIISFRKEIPLEFVNSVYQQTLMTARKIIEDELPSDRIRNIKIRCRGFRNLTPNAKIDEPSTSMQFGKAHLNMQQDKIYYDPSWWDWADGE